MTALSQNKQVLPIDTDTTTILPYTTTQAQANCDPACQMLGSSPLNPARRLAGALAADQFIFIFFTLGKNKIRYRESLIIWPRLWGAGAGPLTGESGGIISGKAEVGKRVAGA